MSDVYCPYCDHSQDINHDDGYGFQEDEIYQQECDKCSRTFAYNTSIMYSHEAWKAPCLNTGKHKWSLTNTHPSCFKKWECEYCSEEKKLSDKDRIKYNIETVENYFKSLTK
jgi:hypothetical protein